MEKLSEAVVLYFVFVVTNATLTLGCPLGCECAWDVEMAWTKTMCRGNGSTEFPRNIFPNTTQLYLRNYKIHHLNASHFRGLTRLRRLYLQRLSIRRIDVDTFDEAGDNLQVDFLFIAT